MNTNPIIAAETASDLRQDILKTGTVLCLFTPLCYIIASFFLSTYASNTSLSGEALTASFMQSSYYAAYSLVVSLIPMLLCIVLLFVLYRRRFSPMMIKPAVPFKSFILTLTAGLISIPLCSAVSEFTVKTIERAGLNISTTDAPHGAFATFAFIAAHVILAPILEELFFRGLILERLRRYGDIFAVLTCAMMFSLLHASFQSFPSAFVSGIIFGLAAVWTGSFLAPAIIHALNNAISVALILISENISSAAAELVFIGVIGALVIISVLAIFIFLKKNPEAFSFVYSGNLLTKKRRAGILFFSLPMIIFIFLSLSSALSAAVA
ncbi:MAG: type II CAAX endopeptidase family protein [Oscillospiraceae bacterium]|nr:type II CAAX endopeptidase family protein [Oscillospiraceae bacterium]